MIQRELKAEKEKYADEEPDKVLWDPEINVEKEKSKNLMILGTIVPQAEIFLKGGHTEDSRKKQLHIKRFDPKNKNSQHLIVSLHIIRIFLESRGEKRR